MTLTIFKRLITNRVVKVVGFCLLALTALCLGNGHDSRRKWSEHYLRRTAQLREEAASGGLTAIQAKEHLAAADLQELAAQRYSSFAWQPWRSLPAPLVTPYELQEIVQRY